MKFQNILHNTIQRVHENFLRYAFEYLQQHLYTRYHFQWVLSYSKSTSFDVQGIVV